MMTIKIGDQIKEKSQVISQVLETFCCLLYMERAQEQTETGRKKQFELNIPSNSQRNPYERKFCIEFLQ